jgi:hypothetical protein
VAEEIAALLFDQTGGDRGRRERVRQAVWKAIRRRELDSPDAMTAAGARHDVILFFRNFDLGFRVRRLRFLARHLAEIGARDEVSREAIEPMRETVYEAIGRYTAAAELKGDLLPDVEADADATLAALADRMGLKALDDEADAQLSEVLALFPKPERRSLILNYLGFPFYDIATLPLLQGEGLDEFDPIKVDRISPDDATAVREGGAAATLKGTQFNSFGAFFSRAYRENDYLWGRLHGADRLIDITVSALPRGTRLPAGAVASLKREAFRAILEEERPRLTNIENLFAELEREIG